MLLEQAEAIAAKHNARITMPKCVYNAGHRAVALRKRCAMWYQERSADEASTATRASDRAHWVFIELLERILAILSPILDLGTVRSGKDNEEINLSNDDNYFAPLSSMLQHPEEEIEPEEYSPTEVMSSSSALGSRQPEPKYGFDVESESEYAQEDVLLAVFCLFDDLGRLRSFLKAVWTQYHQRNCELPTVSVLTNTVIDIARRAENRFNNDFPPYQGFEATKRVVFGDDLERIDGLGDDNPMLLRTHGLLTFALCDHLAKPMESPFLPQDNESDDSALNRSEKERIERFRQDEMMIGDLLEEICLLDSVPDYNIPVQDELTAGLRRMLCTREIPSIWLAFAIQVFLDIKNIMQDQIPRGLQDLQAMGRQAYERVQKKLKFVKLLEVTTKNRPSWSAAFMRDHDRFLSKIDTWVIQDALSQAKKVVGKKIHFEPSPKDPYYLLRSHPLLCGILAFHIEFELAMHGLHLSDCAGTIFVVHFYNALRQEFQGPNRVKQAAQAGKDDGEVETTGAQRKGGPTKISDESRYDLTPTWPDMDLVLSLFEERDLFMGEAPKGVGNSLKRMLLVIGTSLKIFASDRRPLNRNSPPIPRRRLNILPEIMDILLNPYIYGRGLGDSTS